MWLLLLLPLGAVGVEYLFVFFLPLVRNFESRLGNGKKRKQKGKKKMKGIKESVLTTGTLPDAQNTASTPPVIAQVVVLYSVPLTAGPNMVARPNEVLSRLYAWP